MRRALSADPKSSAQSLVADALGPSEQKISKSTLGLMPTREAMELMKVAFHGSPFYSDMHVLYLCMYMTAYSCIAIQ